MSEFDADWLALREVADERSRARLPLDLLRQSRREDPLRILDLGSGTGANLRYLAPRIGGAQTWLLTDVSPRLLGATESRMRAWASSHGYGLTGGADAVEIAGPGFRCGYRLHVVDIARELTRLPIPGQDLVTASALLDLVSDQWVEELVQRCRAAGSDVLFALTYDGRVECEPGVDDDALVLASVNRHQRTDKGFGPAMGPLAWERTKNKLSREGYRVLRRSSDWRIEPGEAELQGALLSGWAEAAAQIAPQLQDRLETWYRNRNRLLMRGLSRLTVGHRDLFGHCGNESGPTRVRGFA